MDLENVWAADISTNFSASNESLTLDMYVPGTYTVGNVSRDELGSVLKVEKLKFLPLEHYQMDKGLQPHLNLESRISLRLKEL